MDMGYSVSCCCLWGLPRKIKLFLLKINRVVKEQPVISKKQEQMVFAY